jgi:hypothetical protein
MPYIIHERREAARNSPVTPGELNYSFTMLMIEAWQERDVAIGVFPNYKVWARDRMDFYWEQSQKNYNGLNDIFGAMGGAIMEFARRVKIDSPTDAQWLHRLAQLNSQIVHEFYNEVAAPYETKKIEENGDVYPI